MFDRRYLDQNEGDRRKLYENWDQIHDSCVNGVGIQRLRQYRPLSLSSQRVDENIQREWIKSGFQKNVRERGRSGRFSG